MVKSAKYKFSNFSLGLQTVNGFRFTTWLGVCVLMFVWACVCVCCEILRTLHDIVVTSSICFNSVICLLDSWLAYDRNGFAVFVSFVGIAASSKEFHFRFEKIDGIRYVLGSHSRRWEHDYLFDNFRITDHQWYPCNMHHVSTHTHTHTYSQHLTWIVQLFANVVSNDSVRNLLPLAFFGGVILWTVEAAIPT